VIATDKNIHVIWVLANNSSAPYFNWFAELASKDKELKMSFICLFPEHPQMVEDMRKFGYDCYWIRYDFNYRKTQMPGATIKLYTLLKKLKPDIIHTHLFDDSLMAMLAAKCAGVKKRFITKGDTGFHYFFTPWWVMLDRLNNSLATHIIAISSESRRFIIEKEHANPDKVHIIHHGIPIGKLTTQNSDYKTKFITEWKLKDRIVVGTIARFIEWKGYKNIITAAEKLAKEYQTILFLFIGKGSQREELERLASSKKLNNNILFIDWIEPDKLPSLYGIMNVYLHGAQYEPFGLVLAEALANAVPVVSTKTGAALDAITHLQSGYLCDNNPEDMCNGVRYVLTSNPNNNIGKAGKSIAEKMYSITTMYANHIKLYKEALSIL